MNNNQYVILTGSKNNAGDFLIKHRAKILFSHFKPNIEIIDYNAWEELTDEKIQLINQSKALILTGGPSLRKDMYPGIYKLTEDLDKIKVPVIAMAVGWKSASGIWTDTLDYPLSEQTKKLLKKINDSGFQSSVRDYHTLAVLQHAGYNNFKMTGCAALYDPDKIGKTTEINPDLPKIRYSLGVSFLKSAKMKTQMQKTIQTLQSKFSSNDFKVLFHHSVEQKNNIEFRDWLIQNNIPWEDISGSAENLIKAYQDCNLHIGYRVHAHIFMLSQRRPSILLSEDGRGKALEKVTGGMIFDAYSYEPSSLLQRVKAKVKADLFSTHEDFDQFVLEQIKTCRKSPIRIRIPDKVIDLYYEEMKSFLNQLP